MTRQLVKSPAYRPLLELRSWSEAVRVRATAGRPVATRYCISPYKTGTTYLAGLFASRRAAHEPLHHTTLRNLDDAGFLRRRAAFLDLELESSGFFAGRLGHVRQFAPDAPVLYLVRPPHKWVGSVLDYFEKLSTTLRYNYPCRLVFDPMCGAQVDRFYDHDEATRARIVRALVEYWIRVYSEPQSDDRALVVRLEQVDQQLEEIQDFLGLPAELVTSAWKRQNPKKRAFALADHADLADLAPEVERLGFTL